MLRILNKRGIPMDQAFRNKVMGTTDLALLEDWIDRAFDVTTAEEIFEGAPDDAPSPKVRS
ncbi:hypothetical protein ACIBI7_26380 [Nonomuraea fuscirosea]|uniref:hypothetical protein n=1 Tax=Nonomuraea fuscirosea TaxID=1291556 RepID=UPI00379155FE